MKENLKVIVSSKSEQKIKAVHSAFQHYFSDKVVSVFGVAAPSGINEQPVGHEETKLGALQRMQASEKQGMTYDYLVGLENGIIKV